MASLSQAPPSRLWETSFLAKDLGDVGGDSLGVVVVVIVEVEVAPVSGEASTFLEASGVCPVGILRPRVRLEREPGGDVSPRGNLQTMEGTILFLGAANEAAACGGFLEMAGEVLLSPWEIFLLPGECFFVPVATARPGPVAASGEGVVVVAFVVLDEKMVGCVLPLMRTRH